MELLLKLLPIYTAFAEGEVAGGVALNSSLFSTITVGANTLVSIIKWAALLWLLVKITMLGFSIITEAKDSSSAFNKVKEQGVALLIGFFIVMTAFLIHGALQDTVNAIGNAGEKGNTTIQSSSTDVFGTPAKAS